MKYKNTKNDFIVDSYIELEDPWQKCDGPQKKRASSPAVSESSSSIPDDTWKLSELKEYADALGVDASAERSKVGVLALIKEAINESDSN